MAASSSQAAMPTTQHHNHGIELTERKSAQFGTREIMEPRQSDIDLKSDGSDDHEDTTRSTNIDRNDMDRMGKRR